MFKNIIMKNNIILFAAFLFFFICNNTQSQEINYTVSDLLLNEHFGYEYLGRTLPEDRVKRDKQAELIFYDFNKLYQNKKYKEAILKIEDAIKVVPHGVFYYYYGNCFMLINNYEYAEKAFLKALSMFNWIFDPWRQIYNDEKEYCFTYDNNGMAREEYFTYYNLACTYSLTNKPDLAFINLKKALEHGFPDINHLFNDPDLNNLFKSSKDIKNQIQEIYDKGFINNFKRKTFYYGRASSVDDYFFIDDKNIRNESNIDFEYERFGIYEVKNYLIIIKYSSENGKRGVNPISGSGGAYEQFEYYRNQINKTEIISIIKMAELWEEVSSGSYSNDSIETIYDKDTTEEINEHITDNLIDNNTVPKKNKVISILLSIDNDYKILFGILFGFFILFILIIIKINVLNTKRKTHDNNN